MHQIEAGKLIIEGITKTANPLELGFGSLQGMDINIFNGHSWIIN